MVPFAQLLMLHIQRRGWSIAEFGRHVGLTTGAISLIIHSKRKPWFERGEAWCAALELEGRDREEFLDAMAIAASPSRVATIVARLERKAR